LGRAAFVSVPASRVELLTRDIVPLIDQLQRSFHKFLMLLVHRACIRLLRRRSQRKSASGPSSQHGRRAICRRLQQ